MDDSRISIRKDDLVENIVDEEVRKMKEIHARKKMISCHAIRVAHAAIRTVKETICNAAASGKRSVSFYVPPRKFFVDILPLDDKTKNDSSICNIQKDNLRASDMVRQCVSEYLEARGFEAVFCGFGQRSVRAFDMHVQCSWTSLVLHEKRQDIVERSLPSRGNLMLECAVCYETGPSSALVPCGHLLCGSCSRKVTKCPVCNTKHFFSQALYKP